MNIKNEYLPNKHLLKTHLPKNSLLILLYTLVVLSAVFSMKSFATTHQTPTKNAAIKTIVVGASQFSAYLPLLKNKRVGLVVNQTSYVNGKHLVDALIEKDVNITTIFAPEHGFRGVLDAGETFEDGIDKVTGISLVSLYGKSKKPSPQIMKTLDVVIFDIQDVGVRFYTFISSMHYMMEASAQANVDFIVLDRPNPQGMYVDGPVLTPKLTPQFISFVGMHNIPLLHGLTVGELALMIQGEDWLKTQEKLNLTVIPNLHYNHNTPYTLPIKPSPNLPNQLSVLLYPSLGFFEATPVSIGRGTPFPFQVIGHDKISLGTFEFTPVSMAGSAIAPKLMNKKLLGTRFDEHLVDSLTDRSKANNKGVNLSYLIQWHKAFQDRGEVFFDRPDFMDKLSGSDTLRKSIQSGETEQQIRQQWQPALRKYLNQRKPYLLYDDVSYYFEAGDLESEHVEANHLETRDVKRIMRK